MKGWCVTCQLRTGKPTRIDLVLFDEPCPNARCDESPHLVQVDFYLMFMPSRRGVFRDLLAL